MQTESTIPKWALDNCESMLARLGYNITDFNFSEEQESDTWYLGHLTVQSKRSKVSAIYQVFDSHDWIEKFEAQLRANYFGLVLRPRLRYKG